MTTTINEHEIKQRAIRCALGLGAAAVAIAPALPDARTRRRMEEAFARGDFATWPYDDEYARRATTPAELLPGARSVVCVAVPYAGSESPAVPPPLHGRVSNYAARSDYHRELAALLSAVAREIDRAAGKAVTAVACDTRPLAERALAARAGLGWVGKHTNLIAPAAGSFVFLGEVVTTLDLPPDTPSRKNCGACARCVQACPTGALRGDYTIDATRCISDLTQRKDGVPRAMRQLVGDWVWGCDLCQLVCPPNARSAVRGTRAGATGAVPLVELLRVRGSRFKKRFRASAMGWRGPAVLRRNAAVALGNGLDRSAVGPLIEAAAADASAMVRGHAVWALGRIGSPRALAALHERRALETDAGVRAEIDAALAVWE